MKEKSGLSGLIRAMKPVLNEGEYVYCMVDASKEIDYRDVICSFKEKEGITLIIPRHVADVQKIPYTYIASWITLTVNSSLEAVGLTAAVSKALADANISCNAVAAFNHDHIFVARRDSERAMNVLRAVAGGK
jgi:hypothetical protein